MISCNNKKKTQEDQTKDDFQQTYNATEDIQEKAALDSNFAKSKEYALQMGKASIEMSKRTFNMKPTDKLFYEFEIALIALKQKTIEMKQNPELSENASYMKRIKVKIDKVLACRQSLKNARLNPVEEKKFQYLCHKK